MLRARPGARPERRRRSDVVAALALVLALLAVGGLLWWTAPAGSTASVTAAVPVAAPPGPAAVPDAFAEAWRAPSGATSAPVVAGPVVVTGDGPAVAGRDAATGAERWSYARDLPLCTVGWGFPGDDDGLGRALALYRNGDWCSELTALRPDTGARADARNPDVRPGTRLIDGGGLVTATGSAYLEVWRSDLVKTLEYGDVPTPRQVGRQPRPECTTTSVAMTSGRLAVVQTCPGETTDRLTLLVPDPSESDKPEEDFSVPLPEAGTTLVAVSDDRVAVALPNPPRLQLLDASGLQVGLIGLDVPDADLAAPPAGGVAPVTADDQRIYWWTGSRTVALDRSELAPLWTLPDTLGPAVPYADRLLVPVPSGLAVVDPAPGTPVGTLPVARDDPDAPVAPAVLGDVLLEQRGAEVVALRPAGG